MTGHVDAAVIVIGAGPCGLIVAIELGRRHIRTIVLEEKTSAAREARLHSGELRIAAALTEAGALADELKDFARKVSEAGASHSPPDPDATMIWCLPFASPCS
jgi:2-polyprenyl-6-methoxyphenol hydroxylase-like FAD-dependent oxidoreductase